MAGYNELQVGRYQRLAQKLFSMKGPGILTSLVPELQLTIPLFHGVENRFLESWEAFGFATTVAAAALNNSVLRLRNPSGSNVLAVIEKVTFSTGAIGNPSFQKDAAGTGDFGTALALTASNLDARSRPQPTLIASTQNNAVFTTGNTIWAGFYAANVTDDMILTEDQEVPLLPNNSYVFRETAANTAMTVSIRWRERFLEDTERV